MIDKMKISQAKNFIERAYREGGEEQYIRELFVNSIEADATHIEFGPEPQGFNAHNKSRLMISDDGVGMGEEELKRYMNTYGLGGKSIGGVHENFGIGSKTSLLPWNKYGLVVISWTKETPKGVMIRLCYDSEENEYGLYKFETDEGEYVNAVEPSFYDKDIDIDWSEIKPSFIKEHGTVIVCLGDTGSEDTFYGPNCNSRLKAIPLFLNKRIWEIPNNVEVKALEPKKNESKNSIHTRFVYGAKYFLEKIEDESSISSKGELLLSCGTKINWFLRKGERKDVSPYAHKNGYISVLYKNELYNTSNHHFTYRTFGISPKEVAKNLTLIIEPNISGDNDIFPESSRNSLRKADGSPINLSDWAEEFANKLPNEIIDAIKDSRPNTTGAIDDDKWKERILLTFGDRFKRSGLKINALGDSKISTTNEDATSDGGINNDNDSNGGHNGGLSHGGNNFTKRPNKPTKPKQSMSLGNENDENGENTKIKGGIPNYRWSSENEEEFDGYGAFWSPPNSVMISGEVVFNRDFPPIAEVFNYWEEEYFSHDIEIVRNAIEVTYGESMVLRICQSEVLIKDKNFGKDKVENELRSPSSLTMSLLGLINEDYVINNKLSYKLRKKTKEADDVI